MAADNDTNGRVSTKEFYEMQLATNEKISSLERNIMQKLECLPTIVKITENNAADIRENKEQIDKIRTRSNWLDGANASLAIIAGIFGFTK